MRNGGPAVALLLLHARAVAYEACAPGYYGRRCTGTCACAADEECDDGIGGTGACSRARQDLLNERAHELRASPQSGMGRLESRLEWCEGPPARLRVDPSSAPGTRLVPNASVSFVWPKPFATAQPALVHAKQDMLSRLGLDEEDVRSEAFRQLFSGCAAAAGVRPFAHAYGGHQFGRWAGQLGDGRAMSLGVVRDRRGGAHPPLEVALKGAGTTPFSRRGDGRAALANLVRELLCDSALVALAVPAVRTAALLASHDGRDAIWRDAWWSGRAARVPAGVLVRVAPSFLRVGSVQLAALSQGPAGVADVAREALAAIAALEAAGDESGEAQPLGHVPAELREACFFAPRARASCAASASADLDAMRCLLERAAERTAALVAGWTAVGFAHGVLNTDNLSLLGLTLDMNVFGFVDRLDPAHSPNHIDTEARYAFGRQRAMAEWALRRLLDALVGLPPEGAPAGGGGTEARAGEGAEGEWLPRAEAEAAAARFGPVYEQCFRARMLLRLGLPPAHGAAHGPAAGQGGAEAAALASNKNYDALIANWTAWLAHSGADYHAASRALADVPIVGPAASEYGEPGGSMHLDAAAEAIVRASEARPGAAAALAEWLAAYRQALLRPVAVGSYGARGPAGAHGEAMRCESGEGPQDGGSCGQGTGEDKPWRELERERVARVRAAVPRFVARTATLRALSAAVESASPHGASALAHALDALSKPYEQEQEQGQGQGQEGGGTASAARSGTRGLRGRATLAESVRAAVEQAAGDAADKTVVVSLATRAWVRAELAAVPIEAQLKTSCGAQ